MDVLVIENKAHELFSDGAPPLHSDLTVIKNYTGDVQCGYDWDGTTFTAPVVTTDYAELRAIAYPPIEEQLDMQYWDSVNGTTTWADAIAKVKADYPKGGE